MKVVLTLMIMAALFGNCARGAVRIEKPCLASWYGEEHRGKLMANGKRFDPDKLTAASWFYPLGTTVRVTLASAGSTQQARSVLVTITDRGPAKRLVRQGRQIDLAHAAFRALAPPEWGLVEVIVQPTVFRRS